MNDRLELALSREVDVPTPYGFEMTDSCMACKMRAKHWFCNLPSDALRSLESIKFTTAYPTEAVLFVEGQHSRGIHILCKGRVKLSIRSPTGKTLITKIAEAGEVLGLSATVSGSPSELQAETAGPCQINFVKRDAFLGFLKEHSDVCLKVAEQLSDKYNAACHEIRTLGLSHCAAEKLAAMLLEWCATSGQATAKVPRVNLTLTQEEIAQRVGISRETVTRLFTEFKNRQIVQCKGSTLLIRDKAALQAMVFTQ